MQNLTQNLIETLETSIYNTKIDPKQQLTFRISHLKTNTHIFGKLEIHIERIW